MAYMDVDIKHESVSIKEHVISYERQHRICTGIGSITLDVSLDSGRTFNPWDSIGIYENGSLQCTYFISDIDKTQPDSKVKITAQDMTKRLTDYFISDSYTIDYPSTVGYWIDKFLNEAGISDSNIIWNTNKLEGNWLSNNTVLGMQGAYEQLIMLLQISGWYMYFTGDGKCVIGELGVDLSDYNVSLDRTDILDIVKSTNDKMLRNRVVVWGGGDSITGAYVYEDYSKHTPWNYGPDDQRTIVIANSNIRTGSTAKRLADTALKEFAKATVEKRITLHGARTDIALGDAVHVTSGVFTGSGLVTTYGTSMSKDGLITYIVLDERCPRLFGYFDFGGYVYTGTWGSGIHRKLLKYYHGWTNFSTGLPEDDQYITDLHINAASLVATTAGSGADGIAKAFYSSGESLPWREIPMPDALYSSADDVTMSGYSQGYESEVAFSGPFSARACILDRDTNIIKLAVDNSSGVTNKGTWTDITGYTGTREVESGWRGWILDIDPSSLSILNSYPVSISGDYSWWVSDIETDSKFDYVTAWRPPLDYTNVYQKYKWYAKTCDVVLDSQANTYFPMGSSFTSTDVTRWFSGTGLHWTKAKAAITDYQNTRKWASIGGTSQTGTPRLFIYEEGQGVRYVTLNDGTMQGYTVYERSGGVYLVFGVDSTNFNYWIVGTSDTAVDKNTIVYNTATYDTQQTWASKLHRGKVFHIARYWGAVDPGDPMHFYYTRFDLDTLEFAQSHQIIPVAHGDMAGWTFGQFECLPYGGYDDDGVQYLGWIYAVNYSDNGEYHWLYGTPQTGLQTEKIPNKPYDGTPLFNCTVSSGGKWTNGNSTPEPVSLNSIYSFCGFSQSPGEFPDTTFQGATFGINGDAPTPCDYFDDGDNDYRQGVGPQYYQSAPGNYVVWMNWQQNYMRAFSVPSMELVAEKDFDTDYNLHGIFTRPEESTGATFVLASNKTGSGNGVLLFLQKNSLEIIKEIDLGATINWYWNQHGDRLQNCGGYFVAGECGDFGVAFKINLSSKAFSSGPSFTVLARKKNDVVKDNYTQIVVASQPIWLDVSNYSPLMAVHGNASTFKTFLSDDTGISEIDAPVSIPYQSKVPYDMRYTSLEIGGDLETKVIISASGGLYIFDPLTYAEDMASPLYTPGSGISASGTPRRIETSSFIPSGQYIFCSLSDGVTNEFYQKDPETDWFFSCNDNLPNTLATIIRLDDRI